MGMINNKEGTMKTLEAFVGGYMGHSFKAEIDFQNSTAEYTVFEIGYKKVSSETITLSGEKITTFLGTLDTVGVTEWKKRYENPGIVDGTSWSLKVCFDDSEELSFTGDNAFPDQWEAFCSSIENLLGKDFG